MTKNGKNTLGTRIRSRECDISILFVNIFSLLNLTMDND